MLCDSNQVMFFFSFLIHHIDELTDNREQIRILVPLCGRSLDLKW